MANITRYPAYYTVKEAMERIGIKRTRLDELHALDDALGRSFWAPPRHRPYPGAKWRYYKKELEEWLLNHAERENAPAPAPAASEGVRT